MTWLIMLFLLLLAAVVQAVVPGPWIFAGAKAPVLLAVVLYYALSSRDACYAFMVGFLAGTIQDALSPIPMGYSAACFCLLGLLAWLARDVVDPESVTTSVAFGAGGGAVGSGLLFLLLFRADLVICSPAQVVWKMAGSAALGMVATPLLFGLGFRMERMVGTAESKESIDGIGGPGWR